MIRVINLRLAQYPYPFAPILQLSWSGTYQSTFDFCHFFYLLHCLYTRQMECRYGVILDESGARRTEYGVSSSGAKTLPLNRR